MTNDSDKKIQVRLDHENRVIRVDSSFYDLKGVLICESTEEEKEKYCCGKFITYPIINDDWQVCDDENVVLFGFSYYEVGKRGDTISLWSIWKALDVNAENNSANYADVLIDLEKHGISVSNRKKDNPEREFSDTIVIGILKESGNRYRIISKPDNYYMPYRLFYIGTDDELYQPNMSTLKKGKYDKRLVDLIANDVYDLSYFFNKPNLKVLVTAAEWDSNGLMSFKYEPIPKGWFYTIQTLDIEINRKVAEIRKKFPNDYYIEKLPIEIAKIYRPMAITEKC